MESKLSKICEDYLTLKMILIFTTNYFSCLSNNHTDLGKSFKCWVYCADEIYDIEEPGAPDSDLQTGNI